MCYSINDIQGLHALGAAVRDISGLSDPRFLFARMCSTAANLLGADATAIALVETDAVRVADCYGMPSALRGTTVDVADQTISETLISGTPHIVVHGTARPTPGMSDDGAAAAFPIGHGGDRRPVPDLFADSSMKSAIVQPIQYGGMVVAILTVGFRNNNSVKPHVFSMIAEFAAFAAPLIASAIRTNRTDQLARDEERQRITQHLHDTSLQLLFSITMSARALDEHGDLPVEAREIVQAIATHAAQASSCMRDTFRSNLPTNGDLPVLLQQLAKSFAARVSIPTQVTTFGQPRPVSPEIEHGIVSTLRESLHNIEKHAHASNVSIGLSFDPVALALVVQDDGIGVNALPDQRTPGSGLGLLGMQRQASALGGEFTCDTNDDGGTTVRMRVPTTAFLAEVGAS